MAAVAPAMAAAMVATTTVTAAATSTATETSFNTETNNITENTTITTTNNNPGGTNVNNYYTTVSATPTSSVLAAKTTKKVTTSLRDIKIHIKISRKTHLKKVTLKLNGKTFKVLKGKSASSEHQPDEPALRQRRHKGHDHRGHLQRQDSPEELHVPPVPGLTSRTGSLTAPSQGPREHLPGALLFYLAHRFYRSRCPPPRNPWPTN